MRDRTLCLLLALFCNAAFADESPVNITAVETPELRLYYYNYLADIAPLAGHFAARLAGRLGRRVVLSEAALAWLGEQSWPGNVRSLEHAIERAAVLSDKEILEPADFRKEPLPAPRSLGGEQGAGSGTLREAVEVAERQAITAALAAAAGNRREAAKRLGVSLRTLFYKMDRYGID